MPFFLGTFYDPTMSFMFVAWYILELIMYDNYLFMGGLSYMDLLVIGIACQLQVRQSYLVAPHKLHFQIVCHLLKDHILQVPDYKVHCCGFGNLFFLVSHIVMSRHDCCIFHSGNCFLYNCNGSITPVSTPPRYES